MSFLLLGFLFLIKWVWLLDLIIARMSYLLLNAAHLNLASCVRANLVTQPP